MNEEIAIIDSHYSFSAMAKSSGRSTAKIDPAPSEELTLSSHIRDLFSQTGIARTILIQDQEHIDLTESLLAGVMDDPVVEGVVSRVDLGSKDIGKLLDTLITIPKFRGVYHPLHEETDNRWFLSPPVLKGLKEVASRGLSFDAPVEPRHLRWIPELARKLPTLKIAIDHIGSPSISAGQREPWGVYMAAAAAATNVWCKVSGLAGLDDKISWNQARINPFVETVVRLFGYDRVMYGSNWSVSQDQSEYAQALEIAISGVGAMTEAQRNLFLGGVARNFYGTD